MNEGAARDERRIGGLSLDFWRFWSGQAISTLGTAFTSFAIPLLIYKLTGSAVNLGLATASTMLPYLFFGLIIGAWVDRLDRKRLMIVTNCLLAAVAASTPILYAAGMLTVWWLYLAGFLGSTLFIFFNSAEYAALPSLVPTDDLTAANGRIEASYSTAFIIGPVLAGGLSALVSLPDLLLVDAASYLIAALTLVLVRGSFNQRSEEAKEPTNIRQDVVEGLRYVLGHPVLRNISLMMAMVNFVSVTFGTQLVLFAKERLAASNSEIGLLFAAEGAGIVALSLLAGPLRKRWSFSRVALTALASEGVCIMAVAFTRFFWLAVPLFGVSAGLGILFNINTRSVRQAIVPNHMLGRVMSIASVLAWSAIPVGSFLGGIAIQRTGNVALVYGVIGIFTVVIPAIFSFTALGHADRYLPAAKEADGEEEGAAVLQVIS